MTWAPDYGWITDFWRDVAAPRAGRTTVLATLFDGDLLMRDALAHALVRDQLRGQAGDGNTISYRYMRAWARSPGPPLLPTEDAIFLGRAKPFSSSSFAEIANDLEHGARGRFMDPRNGMTGNVIKYEGRAFTRKDLEEASPEPWRRCDRDYAVILYRQLKDRIGDEHRVLSIGGLGTLGTLGAALILSNEGKREQLRQEIDQVAPWSDDLRPVEAFEICVRIDVRGESQLANFLNTPDFEFLVEAVAIEGGPVRVRKDTGTQLELVYGGGRSGGALRAYGQPEVRLPRARFELLHHMLTQAKRTRPDDLCKDLGFAAGERGKTPKAKKRERGRLSKLIHDLNASLRQIPGVGTYRPIRYSRRDERYVLEGAQFALVAEGGSPRPKRRTSRRTRTRTPA